MCGWDSYCCREYCEGDRGSVNDSFCASCADSASASVPVPDPETSSYPYPSALGLRELSSDGWPDVDVDPDPEAEEDDARPSICDWSSCCASDDDVRGVVPICGG